MTTASKKLVLIADDELGSAYVTATLVELDTGFETILAEDGREALDLSERRKPDMAVLDIRMPHIDGLDVARRLRERHPDKPPVLVAVTGADFEVAAASGIFDLVLRKPIDYEALTAFLLQRAA